MSERLVQFVVRVDMELLAGDQWQVRQPIPTANFQDEGAIGERDGQRVCLDAQPSELQLDIEPGPYVIPPIEQQRAC